MKSEILNKLDLRIIYRKLHVKFGISSYDISRDLEVQTYAASQHIKIPKAKPVQILIESYKNMKA